jgi:hypothetical protein
VNSARCPSIFVVKVPCIHRATHALFDRYYHVDLACLPEEQKTCFLAVDTDVLLPHQFLALRSQMTKADLEPPFLDLSGGSFRTASPLDYFEDEKGEPLDSVMLAAVMTGNSHPVVLNDARSIMRIGPCGTRSAETISVKQANHMAHFLQLVEVIGNSNWRMERSTITATGGFSTQDRMPHFKCPSLSDTYAVLLPLRQLFFEGGKSAFGLAINSYKHVVCDERKILWMTHLHRRLKTTMRSSPAMPVLGECSVESLVNAIMYGAGLVHWHASEPRNKELFVEIVQKHRREWVVFAFTLSCQQLFGIAHQAYCVIRQDFEYWRATGLCPESDIMKMAHLFESHPLA